MIEWTKFDPNDKSTWPENCTTVFIACLKKRKPKFYREAFLNMADTWMVSERDKAFRRSSIVPLGEFDENSLAWTNVNVPDWWIPKEEK